jgi:adenylate cyclase
MPRGTITPLYPDRRAVSSPEAGVRHHLQHLLHSPHFDAAGRSREFLCFIVEEKLSGRGEDLNQTAIAMQVFGRGAGFDPILDPIVRVQAGRLRRSLERYYLLVGNIEPLRIELPKGSYAPQFVTKSVEQSGQDVALKPVTLAHVAPEWPKVVIYPFTTPSQDETLAARLKDELATELGRYGDVHVIRGRDLDRLDLRQQASVRFELRGSLRREGDDCLIGAQLTDRTTGEQIWSDEYHTGEPPDRWVVRIEDVARIIAARVGAEQGVIARVLASEHCSRAPESFRHFAPIVRSYRFLFFRHLDELRPAIEHLEDLTSREPDIATAWTYLARLYLIDYSFEVSDRPAPIDKAISCACQGVLLDPAGIRVRCVLAAALLVKGELQAARNELEQTLRISGDSLVYREIVGWLLALTGEWERGIEIMRDTVQRNPYCLPHVKFGAWADHVRRGEYDQAYVAALEYQDPTFFWRSLMITSSLGHLGRIGEARPIAAELLRIKPGFPERGRTLIGYYLKHAELRDNVIEGLDRAGLTLA